MRLHTNIYVRVIPTATDCLLLKREKICQRKLFFRKSVPEFPNDINHNQRAAEFRIHAAKNHSYENTCRLFDK